MARLAGIPAVMGAFHQWQMDLIAEISTQTLIELDE